MGAATALCDQRVLFAAVNDLIRMQRATGRPRDLLAFDELGAPREELERHCSRERA